MMKCPNCGAATSADDASRATCSYCGTMLPHAAAALETDAAMRRLLEDRDGDGVPDGIHALAALEAAQAHATAAATERDSDRVELLRLQDLRRLSLSTRIDWPKVVILGAIIGFLASIPWHLVLVRWMDRDPWFGAHSSLFCPTVCAGCTGPYVIFAWTPYSTPTGSSGERTAVYCQVQREQFSGYSEADFLTGLHVNRKFELPGGTSALWFSSFAAWLALSLPFAYILERRAVTRRRAQTSRLDVQILEVEKRLQAAE
jgi:hypothetical protein